MKDEQVGAVFAALGDATRRDLVRRLNEHGPASASELARHLPVSRQAVAKHLQTLEDAGLVAAERSGREVLFRFTPAPMADATDWMASAGAAWDERLTRLKKRLG